MGAGADTGASASLGRVRVCVPTCARVLDTDLRASLASSSISGAVDAHVIGNVDVNANGEGAGDDAQAESKGKVEGEGEGDGESDDAQAKGGVQSEGEGEGEIANLEGFNPVPVDPTSIGGKGSGFSPRTPSLPPARAREPAPTRWVSASVSHITFASSSTNDSRRPSMMRDVAIEQGATISLCVRVRRGVCAWFAYARVCVFAYIARASWYGTITI
ncbi:hypothetical protein JR316_0000285 [Psilocybe cubensis]|uniref:Uncharacterized protein n=2 Tax=Psilocybe cubensis TaxID=181762 RepID=A0A8H7Y725_PSICU|nr:hypothetical protein JR316_0000285 [Psilocybe cubensis]KAH9486221.1 hypothetical protein JR316_0000285 [Psilocybe cubensis]